MNKTEGAALLNGLGIAAVDVVRDGKLMRFELPCREGTLVHAPKGLTVFEVYWAQLARQLRICAGRNLNPHREVAQEERCGTLVVSHRRTALTSKPSSSCAGVARVRRRMLLAPTTADEACCMR